MVGTGAPILFGVIVSVICVVTSYEKDLKRQRARMAAFVDRGRLTEAEAAEILTGKTPTPAAKGAR